jgi:hypothetical protein
MCRCCIATNFPSLFTNGEIKTAMEYSAGGADLSTGVLVHQCTFWVPGFQLPLCLVVGAGAFSALASAKRKQSAKKSESAERERKKARIRAFSSTQSGNPVSEPKAARQGEKQRL